MIVFQVLQHYNSKIQSSGIISRNFDIPSSGYCELNEVTKFELN